MDRKFEIGAKVETDRGKGEVAYYGETQFADGFWVGIILNEPKGLNNGTVKGVEYFKCENKHGIFFRPSQVKLESRSRMQPPTNLRIPNASSRTDLASMKKKSTSSTPNMTPSSSTERLRSMESVASIGVTTSAGSKMPVHNKGSSSHLENKAGAQKTEQKSRLSSNAGRSSSTAISKSASTNSTNTPSSLEEEKDVDDVARTEGVKGMVKKMEESSISSPGFGTPILPPGMDETNELEWLRIQHKDLSEKLETLRQKRKEDHVKLLELERCRIQIQGLEEFKIKMCEAHKELQKKLQEKESELRQLNIKKTDDDNLAEIEERLELVTLDREMAEEKAEILQAELDAQKEKVAELEMELEILKSEMERQVDATENQNAVVKVKQLEQQNSMLREAIVKLRDALGQAVDDKQEAKKDNETLREENTAFFKLVEKSKEEAKIAQETIAELREQVDAVMGSEEMIEKLTEKNLGMEEKIHSLEEAIEDLEALHAMDEEIVETQKETEKDLRLELDEMQCRIAELNRQIKADLDLAEEHDKVVQKFRQKISELNHTNQDYTDQILRLKEQIQEISNGELGSEKILGLITASHVFVEEVEKEMKIVELESALKRANYLEAFLPDNFSKAGGDNDAVILNVLFPRLAHKASALSKLLSLKYPPVPGGLRREHVTKSHKSDQWAHVTMFIYYLRSLITVVHKFQSSIQRCSVERLSRLSQMHVEMSSQERAVDQYIKLLRMDRLDENTGVENLQKIISYFQNVFSVHMASEWFDGRTLFNDVLSELEAGLQWSKINVQRIGFFLLPDQEESDLGQLEAALLAAISDCQQLVIRVRNRIPSEGEFNLPQELDDRLLCALCSLEKGATILDRFCSMASTQLSMLPDVEGMEVERLKEMLLGAIEKTHGKGKDAQSGEIVKSHLYNLRSTLVEIANDIEKDITVNKEVEEKPFPPLLERAHARKQDAVEAESLRWQVEKKEAEITELRKTIRSKNDDLSNFRLRLEMAQSKIESSDKADEARMQVLQSKCDDLVVELRKKQAEFDETVRGLQKDLTILEEENHYLKDASKHMCKKTLLMNLNNSLTQNSVTSVPSTPVGISGSVVSHLPEIEYLESELIDKQQVIKYAESRIRHLKARIVELEMKALHPVELPNTICGPLTLVSATQNHTKKVIDDLVKEAELLFLEANKFQVPYVDDFTKSSDVRKAEQRLRSRRVNEINRRINDLKLRVQKLLVKMYADDQPDFIKTKFTQDTLINTPVEDKTTEQQTAEAVRGIKSERFKRAFSNLFGNLENERRDFEQRHLTPIAAH